jgi:2,3-dimethylmalate lyase
MVEECERIGAAGLFIEDQEWPNRCGYMVGKRVLSVDDFLPKLKAAVYARKNHNFTIMARTDAISVYGIDKQLGRLKYILESELI